MLSLLQNGLAFIVAGTLAIILAGIQVATADRALKRDLRGALILLLISAVLYSLGWALAAAGLFTSGPEVGPRELIRLGAALALAFGVVRASVSFFLWVLRFRARQTPKILRDVLDFALYSLVAIPILRETLKIDLAGLLATSAILSVVIGLALQDTLGNLFAGLSIQVERPFQVGDFVTVGEHTGQIVQIAWRATRLETVRGEAITLPNNLVSKQAVINFSRAAQPVGHDVFMRLSYDAAPNRVRRLLLDVAAECPEVLTDPPPIARLVEYGDSSVRYQLRFFVSDFPMRDHMAAEILSRVWYRLRREGIEIPFPQRVLHIRGEEPKRGLSTDDVVALLQTIDLFATLPEQEHAWLAHEMRPRIFGDGEVVIRAGDEGNTFYVVARGEVSVRGGKQGGEVMRLAAGSYFGEMSLLTGEPRVATVTARGDCVLLELGRPAFSRLFNNHPHLARSLSAMLAKRRAQLETPDNPDGEGSAATLESRRILGRLRQIFGLAAE